MTTLTLGSATPPDDPRRRLAWVLPLAVLLVLLGVLWAGRWLRQPELPAPPPPVDARIYELPPSRAAAPARPSPPAAAARQPAAPAAKPVPRGPAVPPSSRVRVPQTPAPKAHAAAPKAPARPTSPAKPRTPPAASNNALNWGRLSSQIDSVASSVVGHSAFAQVHDPHTLVARYYLAALLEKMQRTGDMVYAGQQTGRVDVRLIVGADGAVKALEVDGVGDAAGLPAVARQIVDLSAPFAPFPAALAKQTARLKLTIHMEFLGMHDVNAR